MNLFDTTVYFDKYMRTDIINDMPVPLFVNSFQVNDPQLVNLNSSDALSSSECHYVNCTYNTCETSLHDLPSVFKYMPISSCDGMTNVTVGQGHVLRSESLFGALVPHRDNSSNNSSDNSCSSSDIIVMKDDVVQRTYAHSFLHWNIDGLQNKLFDSEFMSFLLMFDFVCLVETFVFSVCQDLFPDFHVFCQPATKLPGRGRPSGGVVCLIKKELMPFVRQVKVVTGNFLLFILDKSLLSAPKNILYVCAYVPPEGSRYYDFLDQSTDGISLLENCLIDNVLEINDFYVILCGDLNGRTANVSQSVQFDDDNFSFRSLCTSIYKYRKEITGL